MLDEAIEYLKLLQLQVQVCLCKIIFSSIISVRRFQGIVKYKGLMKARLPILLSINSSPWQRGACMSLTYTFLLLGELVYDQISFRYRTSVGAKMQVI